RRQQWATNLATANYQIVWPDEYANGPAEFCAVCPGVADYDLVGEAIGSDRRTNLAYSRPSDDYRGQPVIRNFLSFAVLDHRHFVPGCYRDLCGEGTCLGFFH